MKNYYMKWLLACLFTGVSLSAYGVADPATLGGTISPAPAIWPRTNPETFQTFTFQINNNGTSTSSVAVKFTVSLSLLDFGESFNPAIHITQLSGNTPFTFTYNPTTKVLTGTLSGTFSQFAANTFRINKLIVQGASPRPQNNIGAIVNITTPAAVNSSLSNDDTDSYTYTTAPLAISGTVYNDANGKNDGLINGNPTNSIGANTLYANLVDSTTGLVIFSKPVNSDGTYIFNSTDGVELNTGYYVVISNGVQSTGRIASTSLSDAVNTAEGTTGSGDANPDGITYVRIESNPVSGVNFGINRTPTSDTKIFNLPNSSFSKVPPSGYPDINTSGNQYFNIPTNSADLVEQGNLRGALSGSDPEDCPASCNTGSTFVLKSMNSGTLLFYDYGGETGVQQVPLNGRILNYDPSKLVIYALEGSGMINNPVGFTYSLEDAAGTQSTPSSYMILTENALPVKLLYFNATATRNNDVALNWATASELNNSGFEIERSVDGIIWNKIGFTASQELSGNSNRALYYSFSDKHPFSGANYYRLKQTDFDGQYEYSPVREAAFESTITLKWYPNPASDQITIENLQSDVWIRIYAVSGALVYERNLSGSTQYQLDLSSLVSGTYYMQFSNSKINISDKLVVQK